MAPCLIRDFGQWGKLKCTTFDARFKGAFGVPTCGPLKPACKRHPLESEIGLTLRRGPQEGGGRLSLDYFSVIRSIK